MEEFRGTRNPELYSTPSLPSIRSGGRFPILRSGSLAELPEVPMLDQANYETIKIEKRGMVAVLTLNRPERLNAVNPAMHSELTSVFSDVQADGDVRAAVITGAGRGFCSGGGLRE